MNILYIVYSLLYSIHAHSRGTRNVTQSCCKREKEGEGGLKITSDVDPDPVVSVSFWIRNRINDPDPSEENLPKSWETRKKIDKNHHIIIYGSGPIISHGQSRIRIHIKLILTHITENNIYIT